MVIVPCFYQVLACLVWTELVFSLAQTKRITLISQLFLGACQWFHNVVLTLAP